MAAGRETVFHSGAESSLSFSARKHLGHSQSPYVQEQHRAPSLRDQCMVPGFLLTDLRYLLSAAHSFFFPRVEHIRCKETCILLLVMCAGPFSLKCSQKHYLYEMECTGAL